MRSPCDAVIDDLLRHHPMDPALIRGYLTVTETSRAIVRARTVAGLLEEVCRIAVEVGGFRTAWIGKIETGTTGLGEAARFGDPRLQVRPHLATFWRAVQAQAAEGCASVAFPDVVNDNSLWQLKDDFNHHGIRCACTIILRVQQRVWGILTLYSDARGCVEGAVREMLEEAVSDVGRAIDTFESTHSPRPRQQSTTAVGEHLRQIVERVNLVAVMLDVDGRVTFCNQFGASLLGWSPSDIAGRDWLSFFVPPDEHSGRSFFDNLRSGTLPLHWHAELVSRDGRRRRVSWSNSPLFDASGKVVGCASIGEDITNRRDTEEVLKDTEERYRLLFDANPLPMWVVDTDTLRFLAANDAAVRQYGYTRDEFLRMKTVDIRLPEDPAALDRSTAPPADSLARVRLVRHRKKDGSIRNVELHSFDIMYGVRPARLIAANDVTEMQHLEHQLRQSQKMEAIGRLAGGVAHDFNNLLMAIRGYTELTLGDLAADHPHRADLEEVHKAAERGAELTRQLLAFSRRQILKPEILDLNSVVAELNRMLLRIIGPDVQLVTHFDPHLCRVRADRGQLGQVLLNLVVNARDAMPQGGTLTIETSRADLDEEYARTHPGVSPGEFAMVAVTDTGTGIARDVMGHLFEPFFTTKEKDKGSGLGLSTVYGIVRQSGGHVWVYSELGEGTTFKIYLPQAAVQATGIPAEPPHVRPARGTETILLVEDDAALRSLTRRILEQFGYRVIEATGPEQAVAIGSGTREPIALLLTDFVMPKIRGDELADVLTRSIAGLRVLYMSGYSGHVVADRARKQTLPFVQKPFTPETLAKRIREVLDK